MEKAEKKYDLVVACIGNSEQDESIVSAAYKRARLHGAPWVVLHVSDMNEKSHPLRLERLLQKATILAANVVKISAPTIREGIASYAKSVHINDQNVLFLIGDTKGWNLPFFTKKSTYRQVRNILPKTNIKIEKIWQEKSPSRKYAFISPIFNFNGLSGMLEAVIYVMLAFLSSLVVQYVVHIPVQSNNYIYMFYIIACVISAIRGGLIPGLIATVFSLLSINVFFLNSDHGFGVQTTRDIFNLLFFFGAAGAVSIIGNGMRVHIIEAKQKEAYLNALLSIGETLNRQLDEKEALTYIHHELEMLFGTDIAFFSYTLMGGKNTLSLRYPAKTEEFTNEEKQAFEICKAEYIGTGHMTTTMPQCNWYFEPMMSASGFEGILAVKLASSDLRFEPNVMNILLSFADLTATIIDRIARTQLMEENRIQQEREKLRTMLLSSVSHDLKTPLASIIGSLDVFHSLGDKLTDEAKRALTQTSYQEALRLDSFITNILDMAKLESGSIKFNQSWESPKDLIDKALSSAQNKLGERKIKNSALKKAYEIEIDLNMTLRALANLFDNISKYTPADSAIKISYQPEVDGRFSILIEDNGPGIDENMLEAIFNKYTRIKKQDSQVAGTGLGLAISRSIIETQGGTLTALRNTSGKGVTFKITFRSYKDASKV